MHVAVVLLCAGSQRQGDSGAAAHRRQRQHALQHQAQQAGEQEANGPSLPHAAAAAHASKPGESTMTSPSQQHPQQQQQRKRHAPGQQDSAAAAKKRARSSLTNGYHPSAAAAAAGAGSSWQQQHWQQLSGLLEGAGQVGGRANSLRFSCGGGGGPDMSAQHGISSKVYGSMDAGFASGSKAEGSLSYGGPDGCCSIGNAMASVANGTAAYRRNEEQEQEHSQEVQHGGDTAGADSGGSRPRMPTHEQGQQVAQSGSTGKPARDSSGRPPSAAAGGGGAAAAAAGGSLQEGEGSHGSRSQDGTRYKRRRRTSCEVASVQHRMASSMQTTEA